MLSRVCCSIVIVVPFKMIFLNLFFDMKKYMQC